MKTYNLPMELLPNWTVCSGHGLHLHYLIDELDLTKKDQLDMRNLYVNGMTLYFKADYMCTNPSHIFRVPYSLNVKDRENIKQTKLFHINTTTNRSIDRLNHFLCTEEEYDTYRNEQKNRSELKRKATMKENGTRRGRKKKESAVVPVEVVKPKLLCNKELAIFLKESTITEPLPDFLGTSVITYEMPKMFKKGNIYDLKCNYSPMSSTSRYTRILRDLHNYAAVRNGLVEGHRTLFTFIYATFCKLCNYFSERCYAEVRSYVEPDFYDEAKLTIEKVYSYDHVYSIPCFRISQLLGFTQYDLDHAFCIYADESVAVSERNKRYHEKVYAGQRKERRERVEKRKEDILNLMNDYSVREISSKLDIPKSTVQRVIKQIREEEKNLKHFQNSLIINGKTRSKKPFKAVREVNWLPFEIQWCILTNQKYRIQEHSINVQE